MQALLLHSHVDERRCVAAIGAVYFSCAASDAVCQMRNGNELNARALLIETLQKCDELTDRNGADKADK